MRYNGADDFLLALMVTKPSRKPSGSGVLWLLVFMFVFILYCFSR